MANNRLHIYCTTCLELTTVAKYYPVEWYVHTEDLATQLNAFLEKHSATCYKGMDGEGMFGLRTENDEDSFITDYSVSPFRLKRKGAIDGTTITGPRTVTIICPECGDVHDVPPAYPSPADMLAQRVCVKCPKTGTWFFVLEDSPETKEATDGTTEKEGPEPGKGEGNPT